MSTPEEGARTLLAFPGPTPAFWFAAATFLVVGAALGYVGGWSHGSPPSAVHGSAAPRAYLYNSRNRPREADVLLLGDSLMEVGVVPDRLASSLGLDPADVKNLGLAGAKPWDVEWLVERLEEPRTSGPRLAVLEVDRAWFEKGDTPLGGYGRCKLAEDAEAGGRAGELERIRGLIGYVMPERRQVRAWIIQFTYDWLCYRAPRLVRAPELEPPKIWDLAPEAQKKATAQVDLRSRKALGSIGSAAVDDFAEHSLSALRLIVDRLRRRSYRVVLFLPPLRRDALDSIEGTPASRERERKMRAAVATPPYLGADGFIEFRDSGALGAEEDAIFIDYGHLNRIGADLQARKLAEAVERLGLLAIPGKAPAPLKAADAAR